MKLCIKILVAIGFVMTQYVCAAFDLHDLEQLAQKYQETQSSDNTDYFNAVYTEYFKKQQIGIYRRVLKLLGLEKDPFPVTDFLKVLSEVLLKEQSSGRVGDFVLGTSLNTGSVCIIFGNLQGAFHSLVRDLKELQRQGIIDGQLKLLDDKYYMFFNGTAVARSPNILQTLFVILLLMEKNPDHIFYLRNDYEDNGAWRERVFAQQVNIEYGSYSEKIYGLFEKFIQSRPKAFYINTPDDTKGLIKITACKSFESDKPERTMGNFFANLKTGQIVTHLLSESSTSDPHGRTLALINGFDIDITVSRLDPLMRLPTVQAATVWRIFSAPTYVFQKLYNFSSDAFAQVHIGKTVGSSVIELYKNMAGQHSFSKSESFGLVSGVQQEKTQEFLDSVPTFINLGSSFDLSKSNFIMGDRVRLGISRVLDKVNSKGGINGRYIRAIFFDDEYTPFIARNNINYLRDEFGVDTILFPIGTPTVLATENLIKSAEICVAFPISGAPALRKPDQKGVVCLRPAFTIEASCSLEYLMKEYSYKNFAFFYQNDEYGQGVMSRVRPVLRKYGIKEWVEMPYERNTTNFSHQIQLLKDKPVEALGLFSASFPTQEFLRQVGAARLTGIQVFSLAFVADDVFESFVRNELGLRCLISRDVPDPKNSDMQLVKEYRQSMDEIKQPYDTYSLEAYIGTEILCDAMTKIKGDITHTAVLTQIESMKSLDFKGLKLNFDPEDRQICKYVWLDFQDGKPWTQVSLDSLAKVPDDPMGQTPEAVSDNKPEQKEKTNAVT